MSDYSAVRQAAQVARNEARLELPTSQTNPFQRAMSDEILLHAELLPPAPGKLDTVLCYKRDSVLRLLSPNYTARLLEERARPGQERPGIDSFKIGELGLSALADKMNCLASQIRRETTIAGHSEDFKGCWSFLNRDVRSLVIFDDQRFDPPRPGTSDLKELPEIARLLGIVGVQQLATTGSTGAIKAYFDNARMLMQNGITPEELNLAKISDLTLQALAIADAATQQQRNLAFGNDAVGRLSISQNRSEIMLRLETVWPMLSQS